MASETSDGVGHCQSCGDQTSTTRGPLGLSIVRDVPARVNVQSRMFSGSPGLSCRPGLGRKNPDFICRVVVAQAKLTSADEAAHTGIANLNSLGNKALGRGLGLARRCDSARRCDAYAEMNRLQHFRRTVMRW